MKPVASRYTEQNNMYNTSKIHAIIFDMDGTVLESEGLFTLAEQRLLSDYGVEADPDALSVFLGMSEDDFYPQFIKKFKINDDIESLKHKLKNYLFIIMKSHLKYIEGFENFYRSIIKKNHLKTALVTNTSRDIVMKVREFINIDSYFSVIITSTDTSDPKPSPVPYSYAMKELAVDPSNTIIIEDSIVGIQSALASKAEVWGITSTMSREDMASFADNIHIFDYYTEISKFLEKRV